MNDDFVEHMKMIQDVVNRLADNSFKYKGWSVTLVTGLLAVAAKDLQAAYAVIALLPATVFWWLDAYYLREERLFRRLFDKVRELNSDPNTQTTDFSMVPTPPPCEDPAMVDYTLFNVAFSKPIAMLHIPLVVVIIAVALALTIWPENAIS